MADDFEIHDASDMAEADLLEVLSIGYGRPFTDDWFAWKHREGPLGPSRPVIARDHDGLLGVVFGLPWRFRVHGATIDGMRLVDGATTPRAVRRGVFRRVVRHLLDPWNPTDRPGIVLATATPEAQAAHVKNGATALEPIEFSYRPVGYSRAAVESGSAVLDGFRPDPLQDTILTERNTDWLRWRVDPRSGISYQASRLVNGDGAHGVVHHTTTHRGVATLVISAEWGPERERRQLVRALALRSRALAVQSPMGPGTATRQRRAALQRGRSLMCIWDRTADDDRLHADPNQRSSWSVDGLDLEGVI